MLVATPAAAPSKGPPTNKPRAPPNAPLATTSGALLDTLVKTFCTCSLDAPETEEATSRAVSLKDF